MNNTKVLKRKGARQFCFKLLVFFRDHDRTGIKVRMKHMHVVTFTLHS